MDIWSTSIATLSSVMYICNSTYDYHNYLSYFATAYFMADIRTCKLDHKLHHLCTFGLLYLIDTHHQMMFLCKMEISTLVLNLIPYAHYKMPLKVLFLPLFVKTRIYDYYYFLNEISNTTTLPLLFCFSILYAVNLYWFAIMVKKIWGNRTKGPYYVNLCHQINTISYLGTVPYFVCSKMSMVHGFISITSFFYHRSIVNKNQKHVMIWFILDSIAIHIVFLLNVISVNSSFLFLSLWVNLFSLIHRIIIVDFTNIKPALSMSYYPIVLDTILILYSDIPTQVKIDYALQFYLMALVLYVEFLNDMSYIGFHVLCWFNAHTMSKIICN